MKPVLEPILNTPDSRKNLADSIVIEKLTDDECADFILLYPKKLDKAFTRALLRMVARDGIRETVRGLIKNA